MKISTRQSFGESLVELAEQSEDIVVLDADLSKSTKTELFAKKFPERFYQMGIAEANMIGTAAGISFTGKVPFACSFGCFLTGRFDIIRMSVAYSNSNVKLVGTHSGLGVGEDGYSQMALEDIALMRSIPNMHIFQPADAYQTKALMRWLVFEHQGPAYLRLTRQNLPLLPEKQANILKLSYVQFFKQAKIVIFATGSMVHEALVAAKILFQHGRLVNVINVCTIKPFDQEGFLDILKGNPQCIVTVEDHNIIGGLGSLIAENLSESSFKTRFFRLGIRDVFGESGSAEQLYEKHGLSGEKISSFLLENV